MKWIGPAVNNIPGPVKSRLKDTPAEDIFDFTRYAFTSFKSHSVSTPAGTVHLDIPANSEFDELLSVNDGGYEPILIREFANRMSNGDIFFDVGGHYGYTTKAASAAGLNPGDIHVFEADRYRMRILQRNCDSKINDVFTFVGSEDSQRATTLDRFVEDHPVPDFVKIDVEGAEYDVITGMEELMSLHRPALFVEVHPHLLPDFGRSEEELMSEIIENYNDVMVADHRSNQSELMPYERVDSLYGSHEEYMLFIE